MEFLGEFNTALKDLYTKPDEYDKRSYLDPVVFKQIIINEIADCEMCLENPENLHDVDLTKKWLLKLKELLELHEQIPY